MLTQVMFFKRLPRPGANLGSSVFRLFSLTSSILLLRPPLPWLCYHALPISLSISWYIEQPRNIFCSPLVLVVLFGDDLLEADTRMAYNHQWRMADSTMTTRHKAASICQQHQKHQKFPSSLPSECCPGLMWLNFCDKMSEEKQS